MTLIARESPSSSVGRRALTAALLALVTAGVVAIYVHKIARRMPDYEVYRRAAERALVAAPLYRPEDGHWQFKYLPAFAVGLLPLALGPEPLVRASWFAGSLLMLVLLLRKSASVLPAALHSRAYLIGVTVVLLGKFYAHELELGQVNILMTTLVVMAVAEMRSGRELGAGLLIAAAVVVKPYAVLLLPWLVARQHVPSLAGAGIGAGVALLLPVPLYGFDENLHLLGGWWETVTGTTAANLGDFNNVSAASVFTRWLGPGSAAQGLAAMLVVALLLIAAAVFVRRPGVPAPEPLEAALLLTMMPIISPQGWDYVFLLSTPATMLLVNYRAALPDVVKPLVTVALIVIAFSIYDLVGVDVYRRIMRLSLITICYLIVIGGLAVLRWRKVA